MRKKTPAEDHSSPSDRMASPSLPVLEEHLQVSVRKEETGKVRAIKKVHEEDLIVSGPVVNESVQIERVPLNQYIDMAPQVRYEGETTIIPVVREEVVVQTRLVLVEEVRITRRQTEETVEKPVTLRKEEVIIERSGNDSDSSEEKIW